MVMIPKSGKDPSITENYCPISLLNTDINVFAEVLARRLNSVMAYMIHQYQVGFIVGRQALDGC